VILAKSAPPTLAVSILTHQAEEFGIRGDIYLDYARAVSRSREVADARVRGVHFLMRKNCPAAAAPAST